MTIRLYAALAATVFFWASSFTGIEAALSDYSPEHLALLRFLFASAALLAYAAVRRPRPLARRDLIGIGVLGLVGIVTYHLPLHYGQITVSAGAAGTLSNTSPIFLALWGTLFLGERLKPVGWLGIAISFAGAVLIGFGEGKTFAFDPGALLVLLAAFSWSIFFAMQKPLLQRYSALDLMTYVVWAGTILLLVFLPGLSTAVRTASTEATLAVAYLGVLPTALAYVTWSHVLSRMPVSRAGSFLYLIPVLAFAIAWLWLGEVPSPLTVAGGIVALAGVMIVNLRGR